MLLGNRLGTGRKNDVCGHLEREHYGHGKCGPCYRYWYWRNTEKARERYKTHQPRRRNGRPDSRTRGLPAGARRVAHRILCGLGQPEQRDLRFEISRVQEFSIAK